MDDDKGGGNDACEDGARLSTEADSTTSDFDEFRLSAIIDVLTHQMCREALTHLVTSESEITLGELAGQIDGPYIVTDPLRRSVHREHHVEMQLYHVHLPKLDEEGLVTFDPQDRTVSITEEGREAMERLF